jgi:hypothetical protein
MRPEVLYPYYMEELVSAGYPLTFDEEEVLCVTPKEQHSDRVCLLHNILDKRCEERRLSHDRKWERQEETNERLRDDLAKIPAQIDSKLEPIHKKIDALTWRIAMMIGGASVVWYFLQLGFKGGK